MVAYPARLIHCVAAAAARSNQGCAAANGLWRDPDTRLVTRLWANHLVCQVGGSGMGSKAEYEARKAAKRTQRAAEAAAKRQAVIEGCEVVPENWTGW
jgi:aspartate/methionine/tyrosine aminotransferase